MGNIRLVCLDADDLMHQNTGESNYNESAYYNFYDPAARLGGFLRLGNRPNEGYAEMTCCLYLPDGRVGFMYGRPRIADNSKFDAGGATVLDVPRVPATPVAAGSTATLPLVVETPLPPGTYALRYTVELGDGSKPIEGQTTVRVPERR